jgi:rare lipoprotein A
MASLILRRKGIIKNVSAKNVLAASALALLTGCTTLPASPPVLSLAPASPPAAALAAETPSLSSSAPLPSLATAAEPAAKVAQPSAPARLAAFAKRLFKKSQVPVAEPGPQPQPEKLVDEKYRLTGEAALELERGHASWYGPRFHGRRTASGEPYDKYALTAAHKTLPFGTIVRVRSLTLGREVDVRINDRGPFAPGRVIDVSDAAAEVLGLKSAGVARVSLNVAESVGEGVQAPRPGRKARSTAVAGKRSLSTAKHRTAAAKRSQPTAKRSASAGKRSASAGKRKAPAAKRR